MFIGYKQTDKQSIYIDFGVMWYLTAAEFAARVELLITGGGGGDQLIGVTVYTIHISIFQFI